MITARETVATLNPQAGAPRVVIFSSFNEKYAPLADIARPNWKAYAEKHGYAVRFYPEAYHEDPSRPETYGDKNKFELYYDLRGHADIVMFLDIDSLFMNLDVRVEDVLSYPTAEPVLFPSLRWSKPFLWTFDDNGPLSGLWIAGTDGRTERHLRYAYERAARQNNVRHGAIEPNGISDQDSMRDLMGIPPFKDTFGHCYPAEDVGHCFESNYAPGKWIIGFPGMPVEEKRKKMLLYANLA